MAAPKTSGSVLVDSPVRRTQLRMRKAERQVAVLQSPLHRSAIFECVPKEPEIRAAIGRGIAKARADVAGA